MDNTSAQNKAIHAKAKMGKKVNPKAEHAEAVRRMKKGIVGPIL